jgi:integrase
VPKASQSASVLDGLASVVAYERDPSAFYLRIYLAEQRSYRQRRIPGVATIQEAEQQAATVYRKFVQAGPASGPHRGTKPGTKLRPRKNNLRELVGLFLDQQEVRRVAGEISERTLKGKRETLLCHLLPFCEAEGISCSRNITIDTFKGYAAYRRSTTPNTKRKEIGRIREFLSFLAEREFLMPAVAAKLGKLLPVIKKTGEDNTANPPISARDWVLIEARLEARCKRGEHPNPRVYYARRLLQCLLRFLLASGLRPAEAKELRWCDLEFSLVGHRYFERESGPKPKEIKKEDYEKMKEANDHGAVLDIAAVEHTIVRVRVLKSKNKTVREVPCDCAKLLTEWRTTQAECAGLSLPEDARVFSVPAKSGETPPFSHNSVNVAWREIIDSLAGKLKGSEFSAKPYTLYSLRHSRAVKLIDEGVGIYDAAKMLGHTVQVFEKHYAPYLSRKRGGELVVAMGIRP